MIDPKELHVILDLETLDTAPTAAVLQVGACAFSLELGVTNTFEATIHLDEATKHGTVDSSTLKFWMFQPEEARKSVMKGIVDSRTVVQDYKTWISTLMRDPYHYWAHASFDFPIFNNLCNVLGESDPHFYRGIRDLRTLRFLAGDVEANIPEEHQGIAHTAKADALRQAYTAIEQLKVLQRKGV